MNELNFFPFYYELFMRAMEKENESFALPGGEESSFTEWQQEYELINFSHQFEYGW